MERPLYLYYYTFIRDKNLTKFDQGSQQPFAIPVAQIKIQRSQLGCFLALVHKTLIFADHNE